ncbi:hypothetical protein ACH5RR_021383 [Cinchona calisaya]|uniref:Uncharacterized protein n=1 Tax=Cinchona calisaya TaxID=153742 RepID=A0ABD2ZI61_9GENT
MAAVRALSQNDENILQRREGDNIILLSGDLRGDSTIGNEWRSGRTCGTTYWITPVRHEAADAESAPMSLAMPCLVPRHGGGSGQKGEGCEGGLVIHTSGRMNGGPTDPGFHERWRVLECLSRALAHTPGTQQRGTTRPFSQRGGWYYWQRPSSKNATGAKRDRHAPGKHSIGRKGSPDGGRARGGRRCLHANQLPRLSSLNFTTGFANECWAGPSRMVSRMRGDPDVRFLGGSGRKTGQRPPGYRD